MSDTTADTETSRRERWPLAVVWLAGVGVLALVARSRGLTPLGLADEFGQALEGNWWGPLAFVVAYTIRPVVAFPGSVLTVLAGVIFGPVWGTIWVLAGSNASTAVTYGAGRFLGGANDSSRVPSIVMRQVERARVRPFVATLVMRLLYLPFDVVGWVGGLSKLPFGRFMAASALGTVPGIVSFVGFGASIDSVTADEPTLDVRLLVFSIALAVGGVVLSRMLASNEGQVLQ